MVAKRALISVSDKEGVIEFARGLTGLGWEIISTGGTAKLLADNGITVLKVSDVTGFPEILDGRVKTLQPKIHGGILARRSPSHMAELKEHGISPIDLVIVNLYPFEKVISQDHTYDQAIENIDIGGPTMVRAAAKNHASVGIVVDPADYGEILKDLGKGDLTKERKEEMARKAFSHTARYDAIISGYLNEKAKQSFPDELTITFEKLGELRYGENSHQKAAAYRSLGNEGILNAQKLQGKEMSFNNYIDADAAYTLVGSFKETACVIVKHTNPCGTAVAETQPDAYEKALSGDPQSAFGGIVAFNKAVEKVTAEKLSELFVEVLIAPDYDDGALTILGEKGNLRVLKLPPVQTTEGKIDLKKVSGGILVQDFDAKTIGKDDLKTVTKTVPTDGQIGDMLFGWKVGKQVKSNAIILVKDLQTIGVGAGQMSRIDSCRLAIEKASQFGHDTNGSILVSDAFFPFPDVVETAAKAGVKAIIQPGGSVKDEDSINACDDKGIAMVFTGVRAFRH